VLSTAAPISTNELVRFVLARVEDDEAALKRRARAHADGEAETLDRLRAETVAKRRIVGTVQQLIVLRDQPCEKPVRDGAVQILRALAAPYAGHSAFRSEWHISHRH
jgi:hypothetical protein